MPFPFVLPTTSAFSFSSSFTSETHPSLPLNASTYRGVVRDSLKKHKRLSPSAQQPHVSTVIASLNGYIPYLLAIDSGLARNGAVQVKCTAPPTIEWRPTLSDSLVPGREPARVKCHSLEHEVAFVLSALASADVLAARAALQPLYSTSGAPVGSQERGAAISAATKHLLDAASIYGYLAERSERPPLPSDPPAPPQLPPCPDVTPSAIRALGALARAEATLLAVLKDDPYPAAVAQDRNANDREWMYKAPDLPKVRAHLFARLCLVAAEHAAQAHALFLAAGSSTAKGSNLLIDDSLTRYADDLRRSSRAKACRFLGIDAELGNQTGTALAWLNAGLQELGAEPRAGADGRKKPSGLGRLKKEWYERREDKKIDRSAGWGADGGRLEEMRVIEMLADKWAKMNDTMNTQVIPPIGPLLAQMPSGREVHTVKPYEVPMLEPHMLEAMRAPPQRSDDYGKDLSSDDEGGRPEAPPPVGSFPGTSEEYRGSPNTYY